MNCDAAREAISALLDDEDPGVDPHDIEDHVSTCRACGLWRAAAHEVTRNARLEPARTVATTSDDLVLAVFARSRPPRRPTTLTWARAGLLAVAALQVLATWRILFEGRDHTAPEHIAREVGAFAMALAVGFVVAAWKPDRALGMRTIVGAIAVLLVMTATLDLLHGRTDLRDEFPHLLAVVGWLLLSYLAAATPSTTVDPGWSVSPAGRGVNGRRRPVGAAVPERSPARVAKRAPAEPGRRRAG